MSALELSDERRRLLVVEIHPFLHVRQLQDLVDAVVLAGLDQLHHQLVVRDPEVAEAPEPGAAVHQEVEQHPAVGGQHLLQGVLGRVGLVDGPHQVRRDAREPLRPAVVVVDHPGRRRCVGVDDVVGGDGGVANGLAAVMVEHEMGVRRVGEVGGDVARADLHLAVLYVLGMDEQDVADHLELLEQHSTHQPIEVTPGDQPVSLRAQGATSSIGQGGRPVSLRSAALARPLTDTAPLFPVDEAPRARSRPSRIRSSPNWYSLP